MKHHIRPPSGRLRGSALVFVLFGLVLCALMVVILMERVTVSSKSTAAYTRSAQLRSFSEMALNLVQAQIRDATTTNQAVSTPLAQRSTWASQPGAIRTYAASGNLQQIYKLYSSDALQTADPDLGKDVPPDWFSRKSDYTDLNEPVTASGTQHYPVLNPNAPALNAGASGITAGYGIANDAPLDTGNPQANQAPMPVRWIYVLEDGTLCQLGDPRISRATNPIIGRIAFWTDDETAKVNINTASASGANSFWDVPRTRVSASSPTESAYSNYKPVQNEYQRYPGHPAMVSLRSILGPLGGLADADYYGLSPYYLWGGSQDGTQPSGAALPTPTPLPNKEDRAYVTLDELLFQSNPNALRAQPLPAQVESLRFFLTASSRAPELNLFGQPRVTIWPISPTNDKNHRTAFDNLIAFDSTIGGKYYYFVRNYPLDPAKDYTDYSRNQDLYAYLQNLTKTKVPGFGNSNFLAKYDNGDRDQILTEIFDYIRAGVNLNETYAGVPFGFESYTPEATGMSTSAAYFSPTASNKGAGFVVPIQIGQTRGSGRFPAITNVGLFFVQHYPRLAWSVDPTTRVGQWP
ncbi:MAG: Verru_Chthon cassette protein A, partial [Terrimicrobiaceae bacterium]|nr:Verru_Chthon cassette protein A [Terrimicrobiaceae bacterium]